MIPISERVPDSCEFQSLLCARSFVENEIEQHSEPQVVFHIGTQRTSTTTMQAFLWPMIPNSIYMGRDYYYDRKNQRYEYMRSPLSLQFRWHMLNRIPIPEPAVSNMVLSLFEMSRRMSKTVIISSEFMEFQNLSKIVNFLNICRMFSKSTEIKYKIVCTIRDPIEFQKSIAAFYLSESNIRRKSEWSAEERMVEFFADTDTFKPVSNANILFDRLLEHNKNPSKSSRILLLENARWEMWDRVVSGICGESSVLFAPIPGAMKDWSFWADALHDGVTPEQRDLLRTYYNQLHEHRPHLNGLLNEDNIDLSNTDRRRAVCQRRDGRNAGHAPGIL